MRKNIKPALGIAGTLIVLTAICISVIVFLKTKSKKDGTDKPRDEIVNVSTTTLSSTVSDIDLEITTPNDQLASGSSATTIDIRTPEAVTLSEFDCTHNGAHYFGNVSRSASGLNCMRWEEAITTIRGIQYLKNLALFNAETWDVVGNKCRNPDNDENGPWCFTINGDIIDVDYCGIPHCQGFDIGCLSNPCLNGGSCLDDDTGIRCESTQEYFGFICEAAATCRNVSAYAISNITNGLYGEACLNWRDVAELFRGTELEEGGFKNYCITQEDEAWLYCYSLKNKAPVTVVCNMKYCQDANDCEPSYEQYTGLETTVQYHFPTTMDAPAITVPCLRWSYFKVVVERDPAMFADYLMYTFTEMFPERDLSQAENFCRNPYHREEGPLCFVYNLIDQTIGPHFCQIPRCTDEQCERDLQCENGGHCIQDSDGSISCDCPQGFTGVRCEIESDCVEDGQLYTGNLSVSQTGKHCFSWTHINTSIPDALYFSTLDAFPDTSWESLANKCRNIRIEGSMYTSPSCLVIVNTAILIERCDVHVCRGTQSMDRQTCKDHLISSMTARASQFTITSSSSFSDMHLPTESKLKPHHNAWTPGAWKPASEDTSPWIKVDLVLVHLIDGIITQGRQDVEEWVTRFQIGYSHLGNHTIYEANGQIHDFTGNSDGNNKVVSILPGQHIVSQIVWLYPIEWHVAPSLRWDLLGCENLSDKDVYRSSQQLGARRAVDGDINQIPSQGSCFSSNNEIFPWWTVDIGFETKMYGVVLIARADCCPNELMTITMCALSDVPNPRLSTSKRELATYYVPVSNNPNGKDIDFQTPEIGRYFSILSQGSLDKHPMTLCEVFLKHTDKFQEECLGSDHTYGGHVDFARDGQACHRWSDFVYYNMTIIDGIHHFPDITFEELGRKCRNPDYDENGPWCLVTGNEEFTKKYCDIPHCEAGNPCLPNPCMNKGKCVIGEDPNAFTCICQPRYTGILCESHDCYVSGSYYRGDLSVTSSGKSCMKWLTMHYDFPNLITFDIFLGTETSWEELSNFCRFISVLNGPGCMVFEDTGLVPRPCTLPLCADKEVVECVRGGNKYNGNVAENFNGLPCYDWEYVLSQNEIAIQNGYNPIFYPMIDGIHNFPDSSFANLGNKCRNPTDGPFPFCVTVMNGQLSMDPCFIPDCSDQNPCYPNPCLNGATCELASENESEFVCLCKHGYFGRYCESDQCMVEGEPFTGDLAIATTGAPCLTWHRVSIVDPNAVTLEMFPDSSWEELANHCRHYGGYETPTCVVMEDEVFGLQYCAVPLCSDIHFPSTESPIISTESTTAYTNSADECYRPTVMYSGHVTMSYCLDWFDVQMYMYNTTLLDLDHFPDASWETIGSKCRNPNQDPGGPWCFTYMGDGEHAFMASCNFPLCEDADDCDPNQCLNGATCVDGLHSFICICPDGYRGNLCESGECRATRDSEYNGTLSISSNGQRCLKWYNLYLWSVAINRRDGNAEIDFGEWASPERENRCSVLAGDDTAPICFTYSTQYIIEPHFCHVPICNEIPFRDCQMPYSMRGYSGDHSISTLGEECVRWEDVHRDAPEIGPHLSLFWDESWDALSNKCRDIYDQTQQVCFVMQNDTYILQECDVPICSDLLANDCAVDQCFNGATCVDGAHQFVCACADGYRGLRCEAGQTDCIGNGKYNGNLSISATGRRCLMWSSHSDIYPLSAFGVSSWDEVSNYCRNPGDALEIPWCIVYIDGSLSFDLCNMISCE